MSCFFTPECSLKVIEARIMLRVAVKLVSYTESRVVLAP